MLRKDLIINGRKFNLLQKFLFNRSGFFIKSTLIFLLIALIVLELSLVSLLTGKAIIIAVFLIIITISTGPIIIEEVIFKNNRMWLLGIEENKKMVATSWIVNKEMLNEVIKNPYNSEIEEVLRVLQKSYGHRIIDDKKKSLYSYSKSMINFIEEPTIELVMHRLKTYPKKEGQKPFFEPFTFDNLTTQEVKQVFMEFKKINANDKFAKKAVDTKAKENLVSILDKELVARIK